MKKKNHFFEWARVVWAIAAKDILDAFKNKTTLSLFLGVSVMVLSGHALPLILKLDTSPMAVVYDASRSTIVRGLVARDDFRFGIVDSEEEMKNIIADSPEVRLGLVMPADFDELAGLEQRVEIQGYYTYWAEPAEVAELAAFFEEQLAGASWRNIHIHFLGNAVYPMPENDGFPFMIAMVLMIVILTIGVALVPLLFVEEKEAHTLGVLMVSPASFGQVIAGKAITGMVLCLLASGVVILFDNKWFVHWDLILLALSLGALFSVLLGLLVGSVVENASGISMWAGLGMSVLLAPTFLMAFVNSSWPAWLVFILPWAPSTALANLVQASMSSPVPTDLLWRSLLSLALGALGVYGLLMWKIRRLDP